MFSVDVVTTLICWFIQPQSKFQFVMMYQFGARYVLINDYRMYSCSISMKVVILCVTVYFTMFCEILLTGYQIMRELCESQ